MGDWRRYLAPAGFLLAVTIAVILIRAGMHSGGATRTGTRLPPPPAAVAVTTTTSTRPAGPRAPARRFWTVQAGDTFGVISARTGVSVVRLEELNPGVSSTSLHIGQKVRIR